MTWSGQASREEIFHFLTLRWIRTIIGLDIMYVYYETSWWRQIALRSWLEVLKVCNRNSASHKFDGQVDHSWCESSQAPKFAGILKNMDLYTGCPKKNFPWRVCCDNCLSSLILIPCDQYSYCDQIISPWCPKMSQICIFQSPTPAKKDQCTRSSCLRQFSSRTILEKGSVHSCAEYDLR